MSKNTIKVVELFAGVGGFRIGLEGASDAYETIWNNQWEPSTKHQDASLVYRARFGSKGHSNQDINTVPTADIPNHDLLVGGFPCQDYSVASTLSRSGGIEGKKGVLWWQIYRILNEKGDNRPSYIFFENVDRLLGSPAKQRGRDFAIILASLADLGYTVEWRVINAAEYGMPQRRRRTYIVGYRENSNVSRQVQELKDWVLYEGVLDNFIESMTGIKNRDIKQAPKLTEALEHLTDWLGDREYKVYAWSDSDRTQILREIKAKNIESAKIADFMKADRWIDYQDVFKKRFDLDRCYSLEDALESAEIEPEGRFHDGLDDAVNTGALIKKLELNPEYEIAKYALPESDEHLSCTIGDLFEGLQLKFG